jgi:hypothetical protein
MLFFSKVSGREFDPETYHPCLIKEAIKAKEDSRSLVLMNADEKKSGSFRQNQEKLKAENSQEYNKVCLQSTIPRKNVNNFYVKIF